MCDCSDQISRERRRRANGARGRLSSNEGGRQPLGPLPAVIFRLRSCTKVLGGKISSTYVYTMLLIVNLCVFLFVLRYESIMGEFQFYSVRDGGVW